VLFPELADKKLYGILAVVDASEAMQQKNISARFVFRQNL